MNLSIFALVLGCLLTCRGLELTLDGTCSRLARTSHICGVLVCKEFANGSLSSMPNSDRTHSEVALDIITSLSVVESSSGDSKNAEDRNETLLGSVTAQSYNFTRVTNGRRIDGTLASDRAILRIELADCESEFSCQVQGNDSQGREVVITTRLVQQPSKHEAGPRHHGRLTPDVAIQLKAAFQQLTQVINTLENRLEDKVSALGNKLEDKTSALKSTLTDKVSALENRLEDKLVIFQNNLFSLQTSLGHLENQGTKVEARLATLENKIGQIQKENTCTSESDVLQCKFDLLASNITAEINDKCLNTSMPPEIGLMASHLALSWKLTKEEIVERLEKLSQEQKENLQNVLGSFENTVRSATAQLASQLECDKCDQTASSATTQQPLRCIKDMEKTFNQSYPQYFTMTQHSLGQDILCDTKTDGGGWTVILRRTKGDVSFYQDWESYKNGLGKPGPNEDFWLGNEAIYKLTNERDYELRIELTIEGVEFSHVYSTFKLESEADKYTLRLGKGTGSLDDGSHGLSYHNNAPFSTYDVDNDSWSKSCASSRECGWWFKNCNWSKLTTPWVYGKAVEAWHDGKKWWDATTIEMKMRPLQSY